MGNPPPPPPPANPRASGHPGIRAFDFLENCWSNARLCRGGGGGGGVEGMPAVGIDWYITRTRYTSLKSRMGIFFNNYSIYLFYYKGALIYLSRSCHAHGRMFWELHDNNEFTTHKNLAVRKIMEVMRTAYAKSGIQSQHISNYTWGKRSRKAHEYCERNARIVCEQHLSILLRIVYWFMEKVLLKLEPFVLFYWYTFPNFCTQISRPLAYSVRISSKASANTVIFCSSWIWSLVISSHGTTSTT